ncbi:hypothetical protein AC249_AIPGENE25262 [Exaiptasia diaphana]|nr:hypothetical protein AC249_AIPGENE25262 [Exaiptasia diaphana]
MNYKAWSADESWMTESGEKILKRIPFGKPPILVPDYRKSPSIETLVDKCEKCKFRFNGQQTAWWQRYIEKERDTRPSWYQIDNVDWALESLEEYDAKCLKQPKIKLSADQIAMDDNLRELLEKSDRCPKSGFRMSGKLALTYRNDHRWKTPTQKKANQEKTSRKQFYEKQTT